MDVVVLAHLNHVADFKFAAFGLEDAPFGFAKEIAQVLRARPGVAGRARFRPGVPVVPPDLVIFPGPIALVSHHGHAAAVQALGDEVGAVIAIGVIPGIETKRPAAGVLRRRTAIVWHESNPPFSRDLRISQCPDSLTTT